MKTFLGLAISVLAISNSAQAANGQVAQAVYAKITCKVSAVRQSDQTVAYWRIKGKAVYYKNRNDLNGIKVPLEYFVSEYDDAREACDRFKDVQGADLVDLFIYKNTLRGAAVHADDIRQTEAAFVTGRPSRAYQGAKVGITCSVLETYDSDSRKSKYSVVGKARIYEGAGDFFGTSAKIESYEFNAKRDAKQLCKDLKTIAHSSSKNGKVVLIEGRDEESTLRAVSDDLSRVGVAPAALIP